MKRILSYKLFEVKSEEELYIFDFDDTLAQSPSFEDLVISYLKEDVTFKDLFLKSLKEIGKSKSDIKVENGRLYIDDPNSEIKVSKNWIRKKGRVYLTPPDKFYFIEDSFPDKVTELAKLYNSSKNVAIVTARIESVRDMLEKYMDKLGLKKPNFGLFMYPKREGDEIERVASWKAKTIVKIIKDTQFKKVHFYDDKSKIVNAVNKLVKSELPDVSFSGHKV